MDLGAHEDPRLARISVWTNRSQDEASGGRGSLAGLLDAGNQHWQRWLANLRRAGHYGMGSPVHANDDVIDGSRTRLFRGQRDRQQVYFSQWGKSRRRRFSYLWSHMVAGPDAILSRRLHAAFLDGDSGKHSRGQAMGLQSSLFHFVEPCCRRQFPRTSQ